MSQTEWLLDLTTRRGGRAARGKTYFEKGHVTNVTVDGRYIGAEVIGTRTYDIQIALTPAHISSCSCPDEVFPCKHVYALAHHVKHTPSLAEKCRDMESTFEPGQYDSRLDTVPQKVRRFLATVALRSHPWLEVLTEPTARAFLCCIEEHTRYRETESHLGTTPHMGIQDLDLLLEALALVQDTSPETVEQVAGWSFVAWVKGLEAAYPDLPDEWIWEDFPISPGRTDYYGLPRFVSGFHRPRLAEEHLEKAMEADDWYALVSDE